MVTKIYIPKLGTNMTEAQIGKWYKSEGEPVRSGEAIVEIITGKTVFQQVEAESSGFLRKRFVEAGASVPIMTVIGIIADRDEAIPDADEVAERPKAARPA